MRELVAVRSFLVKAENADAEHGLHGAPLEKELSLP